jgi:hypothetical protein
MGCGASHGPAVAEHLLGSAPLAEKVRRKKNHLLRHEHLLNAIDETIDALKAFREYALQIQQPWQDLKAFIHDKEDNPDELQVMLF